jgi:hypothetical protein
MNTLTITKNNVTFEIDPKTDRYGQNRVVARLGDKIAYGEIPGIPSRAYPRIEFHFNHDQWLHELADKRGWILDDYETSDDAEKRPTDYCTFNLTDAEAEEITNFRNPAPGTEPIHSAEPMSETDFDIDSGLGIGGINNDQSMPTIPSVSALEKIQEMHDTDIICKRCGASQKFDGVMFTTLGGSNICDDCAA